VWPDWLDKVITAGPVGIFALLWWLERSERVANSKQFFDAMIETKIALEALVRIVTPQGRQ
jgi:hypothetical protein